MIVLHILFLLFGILITAFLAAFVTSSITEQKLRAAILSNILMVIFVVAWFGGYFLCPATEHVIIPGLVLTGLGALLFFGPIGKEKRLVVGDITETVDERDTMFAREEYQPGTEKYETYYAAHPELKETDDRIRALPVLLKPGGRYYDPDRSEGITDTFRKISKMTTRVDGDVNPGRVEIDPVTMTAEIKTLAMKMGADEVGVGELNPMFVYSHVGRGPEPWGEPIVNNHRFAICFTLEMGYRYVEQAPMLPTVEETARKYHEAAWISVELAKHIRSLGYPARAHISDSNYQIMLPPVAVDCSLGELGRCGYLISRRFGARVRLGGVTTDLPLICDRPITFGVQDFCERCRKCAVNCPSNAIPTGPAVDVRGVVKWPTDIQQCIRYWRIAGTDCGLCMKVCPFSHPDTFVHRVVKAGIRRSVIARQFSLWMDDLFYGRRARWEKI